ncbi:hypothetical protein ES319_A12G206900v1, partial [Gossypium barbadense]
GKLEFSNSYTESNELIGYNDDILINVLIRLPGNPYFSRCLNQIPMFPSAIFLQMQLSLNKPKYHFLSLDRNPVREPSVQSFTFVDDPAGIRILQSCNGLLLCCSNNRLGEYNRNYYIYNPTTHQYTTLPKPDNRTQSPNTIFGVILAFDPLKSVHYRVIFVRSSETSPHLYQLEMYSSETHQWSFSSEISKVNNFSQGVYCCGGIHWRNNSGSFLRFDVHQERFQEIPMPKIPDDWDQQTKCRYFGEWSTSQFNVYEMKNNFSGWFVKYQVDLNALISANPKMTQSNCHALEHWDYYAFRVLAIVVGEGSGQGSSSPFMVLHVPGKVITYSFKDKTSTLLHDFAPDCTDIEGCTTFEYDYAYPLYYNFSQ